MIFVREKATIPSKRFRSYISTPLGSKIICKQFYKSFQKCVGTNYGAKICYHRKKSMYRTKFNCVYGITEKRLGVIINVSIARKHRTFVGLIKYSNGSVSCCPLFSGAIPTTILNVWIYLRSPKSNPSLLLKTGTTVVLAYLQLTYCFFNIQLSSTSHNWFSRAAGTFCILLRTNTEKNRCIVKMPSSKHLSLSEQVYVMLGRNSNIFVKDIWLSKAGSNIKKGFQPTVRGVAMNPIDHPHGGRTKSNSPERTPWGKIAKRNK